jgi:hypothetical protein
VAFWTMPLSSSPTPLLFPSNSHTGDAVQPPQSLVGAHSTAASSCRYLVDSGSKSRHFLILSFSLSGAHHLMPSLVVSLQRIVGSDLDRAASAWSSPVRMQPPQEVAPRTADLAQNLAEVPRSSYTSPSTSRTTGTASPSTTGRLAEAFPVTGELSFPILFWPSDRNRTAQFRRS